MELSLEEALAQYQPDPTEIAIVNGKARFTSPAWLVYMYPATEGTFIFRKSFEDLSR